MDDGNDRSQRRGDAYHEPDAESRSRPLAHGRPASSGDGNARSGGLLHRYGRRSDDAEAQPNSLAGAPPQQPGEEGWRAADPAPQRQSGDRYMPGGNAYSNEHDNAPRNAPAPQPNAREPYSTPLNDRLRRAQQEEREGIRGAWDAFTGQARRIGESFRRVTDNMRTPRAGDWRATDFDSRTLEAWDRQDSIPFDVPHDPDQPYAGPARPGARRGEGQRHVDSHRASPPPRDRGGWNDGPADWDDEWDAGWETGTWDTGWATGFQPSMEYARPGGQNNEFDSGFWAPGRRDQYRDPYELEEDALSRSLSSLAQLSVMGDSIGRLARVRILLRRRPAAAAMLAFFLLGFMLTCCAPLIPVLRLGYDAADAARRVSSLQTILAGGSSALFNTSKLAEVRTEVNGITHDLYEINGAMNLAGAPFAAVSPTMRNYRLLVRIGFDLTASADEGLDVAQTLLTPLQGGALSADSSTPGLTQADIDQARGVLGDAAIRIQDAITAYQALDSGALPAQLQPGSKYGKLLGLLPTAQAAIGELNVLLGSAPALLGIGQPANYLVVAMDRTELRPVGGLMGNYGVLTLEGGKQSKKYPLQLYDTYELDKDYYARHIDPNNCHDTGPQTPLYYWWFPYGFDQGCNVGWGLRDSGLSPDFPTNAETALKIAQDSGAMPNPAPLQGVIAFTPVLIENLLKVTGGSLPMPDYHVTVTPDNLEHEIHEFQLGAKQSASTPRKTFTHELAQALLARIKQLHGAALKPVLAAAEQSLKDKDLQIYFADPRAELILQQLGLASEVNTGSGDGFFVVDTNDGGNKANLWVTEHQTDVVTLLPDGGALHHLQIVVKYDKGGSVYNGDVPFEDYSDLQRTYLPGDATILGFSGFNPNAMFPTTCSGAYATLITACESWHAIHGAVTNSDVPGRTMVMGPLLVMCGTLSTTLQETAADFASYDSSQDFLVCDGKHPVAHTQTIYIDWYTPHAFRIDANGHGSYSEVAEKQPGSVDTLTVYIDISQLHARQPRTGSSTITDDGAFAQLTQGKKPVFNGPLMSNTTVSINF